MYLAEYCVVLCLFTCGFLVCVSGFGEHRLLRTVACAFPLGCSLWVVCSYTVALLPGVEKDLFGYNHHLTAGLLLLLSLCCLVITLWNKQLSLKVVSSLLIGAGCYLLLSVGFTLLKIVIMSGDSLMHVHPHVGMAVMKEGRAFNLPLAALAEILSKDRFFFSFYGLYALSLLLLVGECIYASVRVAGKKSALTMAGCGMLLLASPHMSAIQAFYVNNHTLFALLLVLAISLLLELRAGRGSWFSLLLSLFSLGVLGVLRLEGQLVALTCLLCFLTGEQLSLREKRSALLLFALMTAPYMFFMTYYSMDGGKVAAGQFFVMLMGTLALPLLYIWEKPPLCRLWHQYTPQWLLAGLALITAILYALVGQGKISRRLGWVFHNAFDVSHWGFVHYVLLASILILLAARLFPAPQSIKTRQRSLDILLHFSMISVLGILFLTAFHGARLGWSSSQNRMLFHFFPVIILWCSIQTGLGLAGPVENKIESYPEQLEGKVGGSGV